MPTKQAGVTDGHRAAPVAAFATAALACACGTLFHMVLRQKNRLVKTAEKLDCTEADLAAKKEKLAMVERELRKSQDDCEVLRGELGASRSQSLLMKRELSSSQRRLESLASELERQKSESRTGVSDGYWEED